MKYIIPCKCKDGNGNIIGVGAQNFIDAVSNNISYYTKAQVIAKIILGDNFVTIDPVTGQTAHVDEYALSFIKTAADTSRANNLYHLPDCPDCNFCKSK